MAAIGFTKFAHILIIECAANDNLQMTIIMLCFVGQVSLLYFFAKNLIIMWSAYPIKSIYHMQGILYSLLEISSSLLKKYMC